MAGFAPHEGMFRAHAGDSILDQIRFAHDQGFRAWEDNEAMRRAPAEQSAIGDLLESLGMTMGVFVALAEFERPLFAGHRLDPHDRNRKSADVRALLSARMHGAVETAKRLRARWATLVPGTLDPTLPPEQQTARVVEMLELCADICEPAGLTLVIEPLNPVDHPGCFLQRMPQAHAICRQLDRPGVKILNDLYHQQITEGNLTANLADAWDEIAYLQVGDVPGRLEPTTGEINYANLFRWIHDRGYRGVIGMEHNVRSPGREGERALMAAYRSVDPAS